jgi:hypothetical protein
MRLHALRLHEATMIAWCRQEILSQGIDRRVINAVKKELGG